MPELMTDLWESLKRFYVGFTVFALFAIFAVSSYASPPIFWFYAGFAIGTVVHEAGHLLCAMLGSIPIRLMSVGVGPVLLRGRIGETWLELRLLPVSGFVSPYPVVSPRKRWLVLLLLGGVLGNAALIAVIIWLESVGAVSTVTNVAWGPIIFAQIVDIVVNLFPFRAKAGKTPVESDGLQLLRLLGWTTRRSTL
jgi:hypothetical protein